MDVDFFSREGRVDVSVQIIVTEFVQINQGTCQLLDMRVELSVLLMETLRAQNVLVEFWSEILLGLLNRFSA